MAGDPKTFPHSSCGRKIDQRGAAHEHPDTEILAGPQIDAIQRPAYASVVSNAIRLETADTLESLSTAIAQREPLLESLAHKALSYDYDAAIRSQAAGAMATRTLQLFRDETRTRIRDADRLRESLLRQSPATPHAVDTCG